MNWFLVMVERWNVYDWDELLNQNGKMLEERAKYDPARNWVHKHESRKLCKKECKVTVCQIKIICYGSFDRCHLKWVHGRTIRLLITKAWELKNWNCHQRKIGWNSILNIS